LQLLSRFFCLWVSPSLLSFCVWVSYAIFCNLLRRFDGRTQQV
jgi:hypothetical protein